MLLWYAVQRTTVCFHPGGLRFTMPRSYWNTLWWGLRDPVVLQIVVLDVEACKLAKYAYSLYRSSNASITAGACTRLSRITLCGVWEYIPHSGQRRFAITAVGVDDIDWGDEEVRLERPSIQHSLRSPYLSLWIPSLYKIFRLF